MTLIHLSLYNLITSMSVGFPGSMDKSPLPLSFSLASTCFHAMLSWRGPWKLPASLLESLHGTGLASVLQNITTKFCYPWSVPASPLLAQPKPSHAALSCWASLTFQAHIQAFLDRSEVAVCQIAPRHACIYVGRRMCLSQLIFYMMAMIVHSCRWAELLHSFR